MNKPKIIKWTSSKGGTRDAPIIGPHIVGLLNGASEELNHPDILVEDARSTSSPLHKHFEWDDTLASKKWRTHQARNILNSLRIVIERGGKEETVTVPAFVNIVIQEPGPMTEEDLTEYDEERDNNPHTPRIRTRQGYATAAKGLATPNYRKYLLAEALRAAETYRAKYALFGDDELAEIFKAIDMTISNNR